MTAMIKDEFYPILGIAEALKAAGNKIFQFTGRSRRSEYWWTFLVVFLANFVLTPFGAFVLSLLTIPLTFRRLHDTGRSGWWWGGLALLKVVLLVVFVYDVLRLSLYHVDVGFDDTGVIVSLLGKYILLVILVAVYRIVLIVMLCIDSYPEPNRYGVSPKYGAEADV